MFKEIPATNKSIAKRKLMCGVAINDSEYLVTTIKNGKTITCPYYKRWRDMIFRCYSKKKIARNKTYADCFVCDEWLVFSNFKAWMIKQDWQGKCLDKDLLIQDNKIYSPENCVFVTHEINTLLNHCISNKGLHPRGVTFHKKTGLYESRCKSYGKNEPLGCYGSSKEASNAYKKFKYNLIATIAENQTEPLRSAMLNYKIKD